MHEIRPLLSRGLINRRCQPYWPYSETQLFLQSLCNFEPLITSGWCSAVVVGSQEWWSTLLCNSTFLGAVGIMLCAALVVPPAHLLSFSCTCCSPIIINYLIIRKWRVLSCWPIKWLHEILEDLQIRSRAQSKLTAAGNPCRSWSSAKFDWGSNCKAKEEIRS